MFNLNLDINCLPPPPIVFILQYMKAPGPKIEGFCVL